jgi:hypothetical protein
MADRSIMAYFAAQPRGTVGNEHRGQYHGPNSQQIDFALAKSIPLHERLNLNLRGEIFNIFNSVIFSNPGTGLTSASTFGYISGTRIDYQPREIQFVARLDF